MFITIVDDYSKMTWIYLIKHNSEFIHVFIQFVTFIEKQLGKNVKGVRTDNAQELINGEAVQYYIQKGMKHESSCTDTP